MCIRIPPEQHADCASDARADTSAEAAFNEHGTVFELTDCVEGRSNEHDEGSSRAQELQSDAGHPYEPHQQSKHAAASNSWP